MKKFLMAIVFGLAALIVVISVDYFNFYDASAKSSNKPSIQELISMRNAYEKECVYLNSEERFHFILDNLSNDMKNVEVSNKEEFNEIFNISFNKVFYQDSIRKQLVKDSIEVLNEMINNYQF